MKPETWDLIEQKYRRSPSYRAIGVSDDEFDRAFVYYKVPLDYREFVLRYGGGYVGTYPIFGLRLAESMGTIGRKHTAPEITEVYRQRHWPGGDSLLVFSVDQSGNPVGLASDGSVWISDVTSDQVQKLGNDFEEFLLKWGLRVLDVGTGE